MAPTAPTAVVTAVQETQQGVQLHGVEVSEEERTGALRGPGRREESLAGARSFDVPGKLSQTYATNSSPGRHQRASYGSDTLCTVPNLTLSL